MPPGENPHAGAARGAMGEMPALPPRHPAVPKK